MKIELVKALRVTELAKTNNEARRCIEAGGVFVDGKNIRDVKHTIDIAASTISVRCGRRERVLSE